MNNPCISTAALSALLGLAAAHAATLGKVKIQNTGSAAIGNVPVTFAQPFRAGDFNAGETLSAAAGGTAAPTQVDVKAKHPDGSVRHAIITLLVDTLTAKQEKEFSLNTVPAKAVAAPIELKDLLATDFDSKVTLTLGDATYETSAEKLLAAGKPAVWLSGDLVSEWHVDASPATAAGAAHPHLSVRFAIRAYQGLGKIRADVTVENNWAYEPNPRGFTYDVNVTLGAGTLYAKTGLKHAHHARWRRVGWYGGEPSVAITQDRDYILSTGAVPYYDKTVKISEANLAAMPADFEPMKNGNLTPDMGDGGAQAGIGPSPQWTAKFLITMDPRARANMIANGNCMGSYPAHYRDKDTQRPVNMDTYPYVSDLGDPEDTKNPKTGKTESLPRPVAETESYRAERAHDPAGSYFPYLFTGDYYHLEELQFWANWKMVIGNPVYRDYAKGLLKWVEVRGQAWGMRNLGHAAYITPDVDPMKAYFREKLENNIAWYTAQYVGNPAANTIGYRYDDAYAPFGLAPWQDDFFTWAMGYLNELGFSSVKPFLLFKTKFVVGRMTDPGFCWLHASAYSLQIGTADKVPYKTLAEIYQANFPGAFTCNGLAMDGYPELGTGYGADMQPALAAAVDVGAPLAQEGWTKYGTRVPKQDFSEAPQYAVVPRSVLGIPQGIRPGSGKPKGSLGGGLWIPGAGTPMKYTLKRGGRVFVDVYDAHGRRTAVLDQGVQAPGDYTWQWPSPSASGIEVPQSVCILKIRLEDVRM